MKALTKSDVGRLGERAAEKYLKKKKYKIIAKNVNEGKSEIDVIARDGETLVFVEVKTRTYVPGHDAISRPADAVNKEKMSYLIRGAARFCSENAAEYGALYKRFDIIEVYLEKRGNKAAAARIEHFENAFGRNG